MYRRRGSCLVVGILLALAAGLPAGAAERPEVQQAIEQLGPAAEVQVNPATGAARFVKLHPARQAGLTAGLQRATSVDDKREAARDFLNRHGAVFGLAQPDAQLTLAEVRQEKSGATHLRYRQHHRGVPVFGAELRAHFDAQGQLSVLNGTVVPNPALDATPRRGAAEAGRTALTLVAATASEAGNLAVRGSRLLVYREGLAQGVPGPDHLAWEVEVSDGAQVREFVYVDAHTGKFVDQITGIHDAMFRRAYDGAHLPTVPPSYPGAPYWVEGDPFPTASSEANNMIVSSKETYDLFSEGFGRDSFDGAGAVMDAIFDRGYGCPNASWNGTFISFCPGVTTDDVTAHEWGHAYTQYTHNLIYAWQPGALNEAYSDIWGETVDLLNGRGNDTPGGPRSGDACTTFTPPRAQLAVNSPAAIAGNYVAQAAQFGPALTPAGLTGDVVLALDADEDGAGATFTTTDACTALTNAAAVAGKIALADRGGCTFVAKVQNAQNAGATGVIIANNVPSGLPGMGGAGAITISSLGITQAAGNAIKGQLAGGVNATLRSTAGAADNSYKWLMGEDAVPPGFNGAIRDLWNPNCYGDPGKVTDTAFYVCDASDGGGVHTNSGIPNHNYALLVDGGTYNGRSISAIGLTKAAHIYFRAQSVYQGPASDFVDHAFSVEQSCEDLIGQDLPDLLTGAPSGQVMTAADCAEVAEAAAAVELRTPPTHCNFQPMLAKNPPDRCEAGTAQANVFFDDFESNPIGPWAVSHTAVVPADFTPRDWAWATELPDRDGAALFGVDFEGGTCDVGGDESGVLYAFSPSITLPPGATNPRLTFDHWVSTEAGWDGGNLKINVNGSGWQLVAPANFTYNPYNRTLFTAAQGNTNPMAGERAFSGADGGSVEGSWGRSHVNVGAYAGPGDTVQLRFDLGTDGCTGTVGWFLDDATVYDCVPDSPPLISINDVTVTEGNSGYTNADFKVTLSHPSAEPVSVVFITLPGTAWPILDFVPDLGKVTIPPLHLEATVRVRVRGDRVREKDETFFVLLLLPHGGAILDGSGKGTILNDDAGRH